jgi:hypothetical protein
MPRLARYMRQSRTVLVATCTAAARSAGQMRSLRVPLRDVALFTSRIRTPTSVDFHVGGGNSYS